MTIYYVLYIFVITFGLLQYIKFSGSKKARIIYLTGIGLFLVFIGGFRMGIGFDYRPYLVFFENASNVSWGELKLLENEFGFNVFLKIITTFSKNPQVLYIVSTAIMVGITFFIIYKYSKIPMISILLYLATNAFISGMNLLRYTLAGMISFLGIYFLKKSKLEYTKKSFTLKHFFKDFLLNFLPFTLIVLLASSFHKSALILIPIYYIVKIPFNYITLLVYTGFGVFYYIFATPIITFLDKVFYNGSYSSTDYLDPGGYQHATFHIVFLIILIIFHEKLLKRDKSNLLYINMYFYAAALYILVAFKTFILSRLTFYFLLYLMLLLPEIITSFLPTKNEEEVVAKMGKKSKKLKLSKKELSIVSKSKDNKIYHYSSLILAVALTLIIQYNAVTSAEYGAHGVFPYRSVFPVVNNINNLNFNNNRDKKAASLYQSSHNNDPDISTYLFNVNDPNYIVFISFNGTGTNYVFQHRIDGWYSQDWAMKPYRDLGFKSDFTGRNNQSFVGVSDGGRVILEKFDQEVIRESLEVEGLSVTIESGGILTGNTLSNIIIDDKNYTFGEDGQNYGEGVNIVVYDKILKTVVDSVHYNPHHYRIWPDRFE